MSKKRSWLCLIKRLFFPEIHQQQQQKMSKRKRWVFGRARRSLAPPPPPQSIQVVKLVELERQSKCEEDAPNLISQCGDKVPTSSESIDNKKSDMASEIQHENDSGSLAVIKIQTCYRGYLARKALRALKGFVKLQAIIRGTAVRRQAMTTLKCLQAIVNIQSEVCIRRSQMVVGKYRHLQLQGLKDEKPQTAMGRRGRLDDRLLSTEDEIDNILRKKEAFLRRQRSKAYSFSHRNSTDSEDSKGEGRLRYWLEQYANDKPPKNDPTNGPKQLKLRNTEGLNNSHMISLHRRSFQNHRKQSSYNEEDGVPTYMAATESAKAKTRSVSSPRARPMYLDSYSDGDSPYKHKLSPMSSINSEITCLSKISNKTNNCSSYQQKSPRVSAPVTPVRSSRTLKDVDVYAESLLR